MSSTESPPDMTAEAAEKAVELLCRAVETAAQDDAASARLAAAGTTVRIAIRDAPDHVVTLRLDGGRPELELDDRSQAETEIDIEADALIAIFERRARLPMTFITGRAAYDGPVRKFLRITPILIAAITPHQTGDRP